MDWAIDSGWFIFTLISVVANIIFIALKSWEIIRNYRKDKKLENEKKITITRQLPKEPKIKFTSIDASVGLATDRFVNLTFEIRNLGDYDTTVTINIAEFTAKGWLNLPTKAKSTMIERIDLEAKGRKKDCKMNFQLLDDFAPNWKEGKVKFHYMFITSEGKEKDSKSKWIPIRKITDKSRII